MKLDTKIMRLPKTVAIPTESNWQLLIEDPKEIKHVVGLLNAQLLIVLEKAKAGKYKTDGKLHHDLTRRMLRIADRHHDAGIFDSEGKQTMALFFAVNYEPTIYDYIRY